MRRLGLAIVMLAAIPAIAPPLFFCIAISTVPASLIAGIAAIAMPVPADRDSGHDIARIVRNDPPRGWFIAR
jgi:hypothetical protein